MRAWNELAQKLQRNIRETLNVKQNFIEIIMKPMRCPLSIVYGMRIIRIADNK